MQTLIDYTDKHNKGLSCNEYCICDIVYKLTKDDCIATINAISKESYTAEITTRKVINKLVDKGYLIRDSNKLLKVSNKWDIPIQSISDTKYQGSKVSLVPIQSITSTDTKYHIPIQSITSTDTKYHGSKVSHEDNVPIQSITTENNTPLKNSIVNNQSTQHIKEKLYKYDKSFYENYLSIKNKKEDTDTPIEMKGSERLVVVDKVKNEIDKMIETDDATYEITVPSQDTNTTSPDDVKNLYNIIRKYSGVVDGTMLDCQQLYNKLLLYPYPPCELLDQMIQGMINKGLSEYYSIASPRKIQQHLGTIFTKLSYKKKSDVYKSKPEDFF